MARVAPYRSCRYGEASCAQPGLHRGEQPEVPEPPADDVLAVGGRASAPHVDQLADQPVRGRQRQPGPVGELGQGQPAVLLVEGAEQGQRAAR